MRRHRWLGVGLIALGTGLVVNSILGPMVFGLIDYPLSQTLMNQTIGLDAVSLAVVAPVAVAAGALALRGHVGGPILGFGPAAYTWYMFLQFVLGPEYGYYPGALPLHLGLFVLSGAIAVGAWAVVGSGDVPTAPRRSGRVRAAVLLGLVAFLLSRYVPMVIDALGGEGLSAEARAGITMFWSILLLDLGIVLPATIAVAAGLFAGRGWATKAMFMLIGWWAFVPASVAAMGIVMVANGDPNASAGQVAVFVAAAVAFAAFAAALYRRLFPRRRADSVAEEPVGRGRLVRVG